MKAALIFHTHTGKGLCLRSELDCARKNYPRLGVSASFAGLHVARVRQSRAGMRNGSVRPPRFREKTRDEVGFPCRPRIKVSGCALTTHLFSLAATSSQYREIPAHCADSRSPARRA